MSIKPVLVPDHDAAALRGLMDRFAEASTGPTRQQLAESRAAVAAAQGVAEALDDRGNPKPVTTGHFADKKYTDKGLPKPYPKLKNTSTGKVRHHPNDPDQGVAEGMLTHKDFEKPDDVDVQKMAKLAARGLLTYVAKTKMNPANLLKKDYYALAAMLEKTNPQLYAAIDDQLSDNDYNWLYFKAAALAANAAAKQGVSEGIMDTVKQTFNDCVVGYPMGTSDEQFIQGWARAIQAETGRDIPLEKLTQLYQDYAERSDELMQSHGTTNESEHNHDHDEEDEGETCPECDGAGCPECYGDEDRDRAYDRARGMERESTDLAEFAPPDSGDGSGDDDGFDEDTLRKLAAQWFNGDEDPQVERLLAAAGWEIGQDEGYDDEPGVFVVQSGDDNGRSYISWPAEELRSDVAEARPDVMRHGGDKTIRVVKKGGKPIGEIGIDAEASPGNGPYYVKLYDGSYDAVGFDTAEEALAELKYAISEGLAEVLGTSPDRLMARTGMNLPHKFPRAGQTNLGNIPGTNLPDSSEQTKKYGQERRANRPDNLKAAIRDQLGKHNRPDLPESGVTEARNNVSVPAALEMLKDARAYLDQFDPEDDDDYFDAYETIAAEFNMESNDSSNDPLTDLLDMYEVNPQQAAQMLADHLQSQSKDVSEGWKSKLAGAAVAGAAALGAGGAQAQTTDKYDPDWNAHSMTHHIRSDVSSTKGINSADPSQNVNDFQKRIQKVSGPNAKGEYKVVVMQGNDIVSHYVTKTPPANWLYKEGVTEAGAENNPVVNAITRRIMLQRTDLLSKYGPEKIGQAVDEVADFVGDVEEIGSSDVSGWVRHVEQMLGNMESGVTEQQVDELSPKTLGSYIKKSSADAATRQGEVSGRNQFGKGAEFAVKAFYGDRIQPHPQRNDTRIAKRQAGVDRAVDRLTKEDMAESQDPVEQLRADIRRFAR